MDAVTLGLGTRNQEDKTLEYGVDRQRHPTDEVLQQHRRLRNVHGLDPVTRTTATSPRSCHSRWRSYNACLAQLLTVKYTKDTELLVLRPIF